MGSVLPIPKNQQQEIQAVRQRLSKQSCQIPWSTVNNEQLMSMLPHFLQDLHFQHCSRW